MPIRGSHVLVCGAGGFIGGYLVNTLFAEGAASVRAVDVKPFDEWYQKNSSADSRVLDLQLREACLEATEGISDKDRDEINRRMRQEVLETDDYPEIVYECTGVTASGTGDRYWVALKGDLTLHGTTKSIPVSARVTVNGNSLRASGDFPLRQSDFGIAPVSAAAGTIRVKDEVKCTFDILARRQE